MHRSINKTTFGLLACISRSYKSRRKRLSDHQLIHQLCATLDLASSKSVKGHCLFIMSFDQPYALKIRVGHHVVCCIRIEVNDSWTTRFICSFFIYFFLKTRSFVLYFYNNFKACSMTRLSRFNSPSCKIICLSFLQCTLGQLEDMDVSWLYLLPAIYTKTFIFCCFKILFCLQEKKPTIYLYSYVYAKCLTYILFLFSVMYMY